MRRTRSALGGLLGLLALALLATPAAAQSSVNAELISSLNLKLLYVAVPITVLVEGILIYTVLKFRNNDEPSPTKENRRLEITWTVATAIILLFVGLASYQVLGSAFIGGAAAADASPDGELAPLAFEYDGATTPSEAGALQVEVQAQKYFWTYVYPEGQEVTLDGETTTIDSNITRRSSSGDALVVPAETPVYFHITSKDWLHAFHVPDLGLKQDAFPGQYHTLKTQATLEEGQSQASYQLYCAEYCGVGHSQMLGTVTVMDQSSFADWLADQQESS